MDPALEELIEAGDPDDEVRVVVRLAPDAAPPPGVRVVSTFGDVATSCVRRGDLRRVWEAPEIVSVKGNHAVDQDPVAGWHDPGRPGPEKPTDDDERRPADIPETGKGVIVACLDWGIDFAHPDFLTPTGATRLLAIWDQRPHSGATPPRYGYGVVHERRAIDAALATSGPYEALGYHPCDADLGHGCHGTHCLSIAAGAGSERTPSGVAPEADLLFVHLDSPHGGSARPLGDWVTLLDGLDFCLGTAGTQPIVISMSLGSEGGPHDGSSPLERALDFAVSSASGRAICQSTGNYYEARTHTAGRLRPGESDRIGWLTTRAEANPHQLEIWYAGADRILARFESREHSISVTVGPGESRTLELDGATVGRVHHRTAEPNNCKNHINAFLYPAAPSGRWELVLEGTDVADGRYHCWVERESGASGGQSHLDDAQIVKRCTTNSVCNGLRPITVGAYDARSTDRPPAPFSSAGPTSDGRWKPDFAAPGVQVLAARSTPCGEAPGDRATLMSGTSMAAPYVAGAVALMFEAAGRPLTIAETRRHLSRTAEAPDSAEDRELRLGDGYVDIERAVAAARATRSAPTEEEPEMTPAVPSAAHAGAITGEAALEGVGLSPAALFDALHARVAIERPDLPVTVIAGPGSRICVQPREGDVLLSRMRGERDRGRLAVLHDGTLHDRERCRALGDVVHDTGRGLYARVIGDGGEVLAIRIADTGRRLPSQHMLIRPADALIPSRVVWEGESVPAEVDEDALTAQWDAHPRVHGWFDGGLTTYLAMAPLFESKGIADGAAYLDQHITNAHFLGHSFPAHSALAAALAQADRALQGATPPPEVHSIWSVNARSIRGRASTLSRHAMGLAVDINPDTNPLIRASDNRDIVQVINAVTGVDLGATQTADAMRQASLTFKATFGDDWLAARRQELDAAVQAGERTRVSALQQTLAAAGRQAASLRRMARTGFFDLDQRLIDALQAAGLTWGGSWRTSKDFMHFELQAPAPAAAGQSVEATWNGSGQAWTAEPGPSKMSDIEVWAGEDTPQAIAAARVCVPHVPMLARHHGQTPDLLLGWNDMPSMPAEIDVVVHLHGFWYPDLDLRRDILPVSGLDLTPIAGASGSGRSRPTLTVLPRGNDTGYKQPGGPYNVYTFPALVTKDGLDDLVRFSVDRFAAEVRGQAPAVGRLILTAHSGGGKALLQILDMHDPPPHQVHVFDALYGAVNALVKWAQRRHAMDRAALDAGARAAEYMPMRGGALRVFYQDRYRKGTRPWSLAVRDALASEISAELARWYRVEASKYDHFQIPHRYGWRLLADASADVPDAYVEATASHEAELALTGETLGELLFERWDENGLGEELPAWPGELIESEPVESEPTGYPGTLTTSRVQETGHLRISEYATDPKEKLGPGQQPSLTEMFWVDFHIVGGTLRVSARTVDAAGKYRSPTLKLGEEFAKALEYFKVTEGIDIHEFMAEWSWMSPTEISTNLLTYRNLLRAGAKPEEAARGTPSGKIATGLGFTQVKVVSDRLEKIDEIGDGKVYQRVQVSFSRPTVGKPPSGGTGTVEEPADGSRVATISPGTRATAGAALVILGASMTLNWLLERDNEKRIHEEVNRKLPEITKEQADEPQLGFLLIFKYTEGHTGLEGASSPPTFESLGWQRGYTRSEAETTWKNTPRYETGYTYEFGWIDPLQTPSPGLLATPFQKVGIGGFEDITKIEFQRAQFKEWGGFDTKGTDGPINAIKWADKARAFRFLILRIPSSIPYVNAGGHRDTHGVTSHDVSVTGGSVPAVDLDGTLAVTVWPADDATAELFKHTTAINDKGGKLDVIPNIDLVRWLRPEQVRLVSTL